MKNSRPTSLPFRFQSKPDIRAAIRSLANNPRPMGVRKLVGIKYKAQSVHRIRVGNYRICYSIVDSELLITVVAAAKHAEIYRILTRRMR